MQRVSLHTLLKTMKTRNITRRKARKEAGTGRPRSPQIVSWKITLADFCCCCYCFILQRWTKRNMTARLNDAVDVRFGLRRFNSAEDRAYCRKLSRCLSGGAALRCSKWWAKTSPEFPGDIHSGNLSLSFQEGLRALSEAVSNPWSCE